MSWDKMLRLLVMLLAFGAYAAGAAAVQPSADDGTSIVVYQTDDDGSDDGDDEGDDEGEDKPMSDGAEDGDDGDTDTDEDEDE